MFLKVPQSWFQRLKAASSAQRQQERRWRQEGIRRQQKQEKKTNTKLSKNEQTCTQNKNETKGKERTPYDRQPQPFREYSNYWKRTLTKQSSGDGRKRHAFVIEERKRNLLVSSEVLRKLGHKNSR